MKLKDADAIREEIANLRVIVMGVRYGKDLLCELMTDYHKHILQAIDNAPTIDAVPVVRCKDCARQKKGFCTIRKDSFGATLLVGEHDFCSDGERKNDGR